MIFLLQLGCIRGLLCAAILPTSLLYIVLSTTGFHFEDEPGL